MRFLLLPFLLIFAFFGTASFSNQAKEKSHKHKEGEKEEHGDHEHEEGEAEEHGDHEHKEGENDHKEGGEEGHEHGEEEGSPNVGPDKGILAADEHDGFKLSPEATKNFELQTEKLSGSGPWRLPKAALLLAGEERNIYRVREGFYKRIDFIAGSANGDSMIVQSKDLKTGDEVVTQGLGFLRIAELAAFGGAPEGHSH